MGTTRTDFLEDARIIFNSPSVQRIIGVLVLLAGVGLIVATRDGPSFAVVIGIVLMAVGFWISYVKNEIAKMRGDRNEGR